jgi:hypothetical protein
MLKSTLAALKGETVTVHLSCEEGDVWIEGALYEDVETGRFYAEEGYLMAAFAEQDVESIRVSDRAQIRLIYRPPCYVKH